MPQGKLFGPKRLPVSESAKVVDGDQTLMSDTELIMDMRYLRKTINIASKRLEAIEAALLK